ncbi:hypothetical protein [Sandaracinus amylolyticus]|uniref:hypothetical protein n=1 Tax=Sandaracinus amylolyticus TaxID=927083 RepID=UPI001F257542|nr:hypothetical protein [Sandaracinus amylolyticus]UJR80499.1 Hypothetical protein I5071_25460 [Sandaracinus amylolyticus]
MRRRSFLAGVPAALGCLGAAAVIAAPRVARARVQTDYAYAWAQVWQASVRLVRVDLGCPITDRDEDIGYVMFDYADAGRTHAGSVELVRTTGSDGIERVRAVVQIPSMPSWVERMILDRLTRKLRDDFGEPPRLARPVRSERERPADPPAEPSDPPADTPAE